MRNLEARGTLATVPPMRLSVAKGPLAGLVLALMLTLAVAGCGGGDDDGDLATARPAPSASDFPAAQGKSLQQVLSAANAQGPVVSPAARVLRVGQNRFSFGVFDLGRKPIEDAQVAIYAAPGRGLQGPAIGPFPSRIEDLTTEPAFEARTTSADPDAAKVVYVTEIALKQPGPWSFGALIRQGDGSYQGSLLATPSLVGQFDPVDVGDRAPRVQTPTESEVADLSEIDTRVPPDDMHRDDLADVLGRKPVVLLFATPALCQSRICGPVVDVAQQVQRDVGGDVAFIHMEVYNDNDASQGVRPQMRAFRLPSEPWLYVIDSDGVVRTAIEGAFSVDELTSALRQVTG
jgi:hypothetical protein